MIERVVITGIGLVSPKCISSNIDEILIEDILTDCEQTNYRMDNISERLEEYIPYKILRRICRFSQLALYSNVLCRRDSEIKIAGENDRIGSILNTSYGPLNVTEGLLNTIINNGPQNVSPTDFSNTVNNCATGQVSITMGLKGVSTTLVGSSAICYAYDLIKNGKADAILVSGVEELNENVRDVANEKGHKVYENSSCILLESYNHAVARDAKIYSEILSCESFYTSNNNMEKVYKEKLPQYQKKASVLGDASVGNRSIREVFEEKKYFDSNKMFGTVFGATEILDNILSAAMIGKNTYYTNTVGIEQKKIEKEEQVVSINIQQGGCCSIIVQAGVN